MKLEKFKSAMPKVATFTCCLLLSGVANAGVSEQDIQVAARTFNFINGLPKGDIEAGLVYDPSIAESKTEAESLNSKMASGLKAGKAKIKSKMIQVSEISGSGLKVLFIMPGLSSKYDSIYGSASKINALTVSTDFDCVAAQKCVMGVASKPNVKIEISRGAADSSGLEFAQALKLLVSEKD